MEGDGECDRMPRKRKGENRQEREERGEKCDELYSLGKAQASRAESQRNVAAKTRGLLNLERMRREEDKGFTNG
jgi:hypothetical protein